jgi:hypothetical protein
MGRTRRTGEWDKFYPIHLSVSITDLRRASERARGVVVGIDDGQTNGINYFIPFVCLSSTIGRTTDGWQNEK